MVSSKVGAFGQALGAAVSGARRDLLSLAAEASDYLRQFHAFREVVETYLDYQSWLEEIHFSQRVGEVLGSATRYAITYKFIRYMLR